MQVERQGHGFSKTQKTVVSWNQERKYPEKFCFTFLLNIAEKTAMPSERTILIKF
jgi:hypothetical protein